MNSNNKAPFKNSAALLNVYFERRKQNFPAMSQRWIAKKMDISQSFLSAILAGEKALPFNRIAEIREILEMDAFATRELHFRLLRELKFDEDLLANMEALSEQNFIPAKLQSTSEFELSSTNDGFLLEKWYFLPLLDLIVVNGFSAEPKWIAQKLGLSVEVATEAWSTLVQAGLVQNTDGRWEKSKRQLRFPSAKADARIQKYHASMLDKVKDELLGVRSRTGFDSRLILTASASSNAASFDKAKRLLEESLVRAVEILNEGDSEEVYNLSVSLIPITKKD